MIDVLVVQSYRILRLSNESKWLGYFHLFYDSSFDVSNGIILSICLSPFDVELNEEFTEDLYFSS